jgi:hypothetical protein
MRAALLISLFCSGRRGPQQANLWLVKDHDILLSHVNDQSVTTSVMYKNNLKNE